MTITLTDRETHAAEQSQVLRQHFGFGPLMHECLTSWNPNDAIVWYPSSGNDYRDLLEFSSNRRDLHGIKRPPHLFIHTSVCGRMSDFRHIGDGYFLYDDKRTSIEAIRVEPVSHSDLLRRTVGLRDAHFAPDGLSNKPDDGRLGWGYLMQIRARSNKWGEHMAWVLRLECRNYDFFVRMIIQAGLRIDSFVQVRQGLGLGGCGLGTTYLTPWLTWAGVREMICDGEFHGDAKSFLKVARTLVKEGAPDVVDFVQVHHQLNPFQWSSYCVDGAQLAPTTRAPSLLAAWEQVRAACIHPASSWANQ